MILNDMLKSPWSIFDDVDERTKQEFELSDILVDIACKVINYRLDNNMTQKDLANTLGIKQPMVSKLESGEYNPSIGFLFNVSKKLGWKFGLNFENNCNNIPIQYDVKEAQLGLVAEETQAYAKYEMLEGQAS